MNLEAKRRHEKDIVREIIGLYCSLKHTGEKKDGMCGECSELAEYALARIDHCPRMEVKNFCSMCPVHCYEPVKRERIREIMRYAGPRMLLHHPLLTLQHMWLQWRDGR